MSTSPASGRFLEKNVCSMWTAIWFPWALAGFVQCCAQLKTGWAGQDKHPVLSELSTLS